MTGFPRHALALLLALSIGIGTACAQPAADPFPGRNEVTVGELLDALAGQVDAIAAAPAVRRDYAQFLRDRQLVDEPGLYADYVRIRIAFEATRAGGLWGVQWRITDRQPQSDHVWTQWRALAIGDGAALPSVTAIAECDELSALFAFVARRIGLSRRSEVGLFWPASNHTVAVWSFAPRSGPRVRIVVPTSQVFLGPAESLGTTGFDPWVQKSIYDYRRQDAAAAMRLPAPVARRFVAAVREVGGRSQVDLQARRNRREREQVASAPR